MTALNLKKPTKQLSPTKYKVVKVQAKVPSARLETRIGQALKALIKEASEISGRSISDIVSEGVEKVATDIVLNHKALTLVAEDQEAFITAMLGSSEPNEALIKAFKKYKDITKS